LTIIVADTTCGLLRNLLKQRGIPFVPQVVIFGEDANHDNEQIDTTTFLQKLKASPSLPKTAVPESPLYYPIVEDAKKKDESVVVIAPTGKPAGPPFGADSRGGVPRVGYPCGGYVNHLVQTWFDGFSS